MSATKKKVPENLVSSKGPRPSRKRRPSNFLNPLSVSILLVVTVVLASGVTYLVAGREPAPPYSKELAAKGETLYGQYCVNCHGENAVGENPADIYEQDEQGNFVAPPLNGTAHSWHHTDEALVKSILEGSERNPRMAAWKETLTTEDAEALVEYIKSYWEPKHFECQGPAHARPECGGHGNLGQ